ncbi:MAG TPA: DUF448 domain-containing protein [Chloroflexi bacterium]|nr:DUF448 domain-containing protein [Chloroflexota bacterium]
MAKQTRKKRKHIPQRTCVGCRTVQPKRSMTRLVRTTEGVQIDLTGKFAGRGAYLHDLRSCWEAGLKGPLARALKTEISAEDHDRLTAFIESLTEETESTIEM